MIFVTRERIPIYTMKNLSDNTNIRDRQQIDDKWQFRL
jgi:hypothetical protein